MQQKRGIEGEIIGWIILGLATLAVILIATGVLPIKSYIEFIKQLLTYK